jgi:hypothetical protein
MKTIKFITILLATSMLFSCEQLTTELKNNGPTLESRLYGTWESAYYIPLIFPIEHIERLGYKTIITDNELIQYAADSIKQRGTYQLQDTTYHKDSNIYTGTIIWLEHEISFSIRQDTLEYRHNKFKGEEITGGSTYGYKKELD